MLNASRETKNDSKFNKLRMMNMTRNVRLRKERAQTKA